MFRQILFAASLLAASTVQAQTSRPASIISRSGDATPAPSSFWAEVRTDLVTSVSGEAEFGPVGTSESSPAAFVISLGASSSHGAILFTRKTGTPLEVGRYRVSERANHADEILALLMTGAADRPTGVYWGRSGWLVVTAASAGNVTGHFQVGGVGFLAKEPSREDRSVSATGSFSAGLANAALQKSEAASDD